MSALLVAIVTLTILGPGALAPANPLVLERVEMRRVTHGYGLDAFGGPGVVRVAVDNCGLLGYRGIMVAEGRGSLPVTVVDCTNRDHAPLADLGLVADVQPGYDLAHRQAVLILWQQ